MNGLVYLLGLLAACRLTSGFTSLQSMTVEEHVARQHWSQALGSSYRAQYAASNKSGVVLIPGLVGTQLQAQWSNWNGGAKCKSSSKGKWKRLWLNLIKIELAPSCAIDKLAMRWTGDSWADTPNVQVRYVRGLAGCEYLDPGNVVTRAATGYYAALSKALQSAGYKPGFDLFGAGYDWRVGGSIPTWRALLKRTVEQSYSNTGKRVVLVAHSMGVMQTTLFLSMMEQAWKDKYIKLYIAAAGPTLGAPAVVKGILSGRQMIPGVSDARTWASEHYSGTGAFAAVFPVEFPEFFVDIADTGEHYQAKDVPRLFGRVGLAGAYPQQAAFHKGVMSAPNVTVDLVYSTGVQTQVGMKYPTFPFNNTVQPQDALGDGDGTVPSRSASYPLRTWPAMQSFPVRATRYQGVEHAGIVKDKQFIALVLKSALGAQ